MVELNRANRGIRPFYFIGGNVSDQADISNTSPVSNAQRAPGKGTDQNSQTITHQNLADSQANVYSYGNPDLDRHAPQRPAELLENAGLSEPTKATIVMIDGSGGVDGAGIRLSLSDISGKPTPGRFIAARSRSVTKWMARPPAVLSWSWPALLMPRASAKAAALPRINQ